MATFKQYEKKNGTKAWLFQAYIGIDEVTGEKKFTTRRGFKTKKEAQATLNRLLVDIEANGFHQTKITTFQQLYEQWLPIYKNTVKPSTYASTLTVFDLYILPKFQHMKLNKITIAYCQKVLNDWYKNYKGYKGFKMKFNLLFNYGVSIEAVPSNPMAKTQTPRKKETEKKLNFYTKEQLIAFLNSYKDEGDAMRSLFFHLLAYTGMRKSEALALSWCDVNFLKSEIKIGKTVAIDEKSKIILQTPKTEKSYRTISIDSFTMKLLTDWQRKQKEYLLKLGHNANKPSQLVFNTDKNGLIRPSYVNGWLKNFYVRHEDMPTITAHGFRHTHCSLLFEAGASMKEVQERLGHKDIQTTMNIYAHVTPEKVKDTADKFAQFMAL